MPGNVQPRLCYWFWHLFMWMFPGWWLEEIEDLFSVMYGIYIVYLGIYLLFVTFYVVVHGFGLVYIVCNFFVISCDHFTLWVKSVRLLLVCCTFCWRWLHYFGFVLFDISSVVYKIINLSDFVLFTHDESYFELHIFSYYNC